MVVLKPALYGTPKPNPINLDTSMTPVTPETNQNLSAMESDDTIDLQDLLLTVAESARLLVIGPSLVGALAYGVAHVMPQTFESTAVLKSPPDGMAPAAMASLMTNNVVLNRSLKALGQLEGADEREAEDRLNALRRSVKAQVGRNDSLLTMTVAARSAEAAKKTAQTILNAAFEESRPRGVEQGKLQAEMTLGKQMLVDLESSGETLKNSMAQAKGNPNADIGALAEAMAQLAGDRLRLQSSLHQLERRAAGVSEGDLLQPPTLPQRAVAPRKGLVAILATLGGGMALLLFVFVRQAWRSGNSTEQQRDRWLALRKTYGLKG
jgi:LPS O-antigen subunit length determinant protein (WzzB/FepE family)